MGNVKREMRAIEVGGRVVAMVATLRRDGVEVGRAVAVLPDAMADLARLRAEQARKAMAITVEV